MHYLRLDFEIHLKSSISELISKYTYSSLLFYRSSLPWIYKNWFPKEKEKVPQLFEPMPKFYPKNGFLMFSSIVVKNSYLFFVNFIFILIFYFLVWIIR